jgi:hypothetical protein
MIFKKAIYLLLIPFLIISAQEYSFHKATGLFMSVGVGPRAPVGDFSENQNIGIGADFSMSYTNSDFLPVFFYANVGFMNFPGKQTFYKNSDYSSLTTNVILLNGGVKYFWPPLIEDIFLLMPFIEAGASAGYFEKGHVFKTDSNKRNFTENNIKTGFQVGGGFSMFMMDVQVSYNYFHNNQFLAFNLRVRIPIFVEF